MQVQVRGAGGHEIEDDADLQGCVDSPVMQSQAVSYVRQCANQADTSTPCVPVIPTNNTELPRPAFGITGRP